jgi:GTP pyrophosphokinase
LGAKLLEVDLRRHHIKLSTVKTEEMQAVAKAFGMQSYDDLLVSIAYGKVTPHQVANRLLPEKVPDLHPKKSQDLTATLQEEIQKPPRPQKEHKGISIKGIDHILYHTAKCCLPVPGDTLVGFVTRGKGVTIHRRDCPNLERLAIDDARLIDVDWKAGDEMTTTARLLVETVDRPGMLAELSALISSVNVNISHMTATTTQDKKANIILNLDIRDRGQLNGIIQKIAQTEGVIRVKR